MRNGVETFGGERMTSETLPLGLAEHQGTPVVSSRKVGEVFEMRHDNVLRTIENALETVDDLSPQFRGVNFILSHYKSRGRKHPEYLLTKDGFTYIAMGFTGTKAAQFKIAYITQFNHMEAALTLREQSRLDFPKLTDAIKLHNPDAKFYHYSNECNMLNKIILGVTAKQFRDMNGIDPKEKSVRSYLSAEQLYLMKEMQNYAVAMIHSGMEFAHRKQKLIELKEYLLSQMGGTKCVN